MLVHVWPVGLGVVLIAVAVGVCLTRVVRVRAPGAAHRADALALFAVYGLVSCASLLGIFAAAYVQPCWRALIVLGLLGLTGAGDSATIRSGENAPAAVPLWMPAAAVAAIVWLCVATPSALGILASTPRVVRDHIIRRTEFRVGGIWPETMHDDEAVVASRTSPTGQLPSIWSTYSGWLEARYGLFHPSFDYIIHALGPANRAQYLERFRTTMPQLVQTVLPTYTQYEPWIEETSWDFYEDLLRRYAVVQKTPVVVLLGAATSRRAAGSTAWRAYGGFWYPDRCARPGPGVSRNAGHAHDRRGRVPGAKSPGPHPSSRLEPSIPRRDHRRAAAHSGHARPVRHEGALPARRGARGDADAAFRIFSLLPGASLEVRHLRVWQVSVSPANQQWLAELVRPRSGQSRTASV